MDFASRIQTSLALSDRIASVFQKKKFGVETDRREEYVLLFCQFSLKQKETFAREIILPLIRDLEAENGVPLLCGIGLPAVNAIHAEESLKTAVDMFQLFFFEEKNFFDYCTSRKDFHISFEEYEAFSNRAFKSILMNLPDAIEEIDRAIDLIGRIHYGNKSAVIMRTMNFTGEMAYRLHRYGFLDADFYHLQDALQEKVLSSLTFREMKSHIHSYYASILSDISSKSRTSRRTMAEQACTYIRENYMQPLTVKELAAITCVSPAYFSRLFKEETGQSCKVFLTNIRMNAALEYLLASDLRLYEISEKVGYRNLRNFEEAFRKQYGCYPGDYKKQMLAGRIENQF